MPGGLGTAWSRSCARGSPCAQNAPGLALGEVDYGPDGQIAYDLGAWAIAWLCHRAGPDVLIERFYPAVEALGWEAAFGEAFELTPAAFYAEFDRFLELDRAQQLAILAAAS